MMTPTRPSPVRALCLASGLLLSVLALSVRADDHSAHQQHGDAHAMSAEDLATLRSKVPLYRTFTDQQINESMGRMRDVEDYLSPPGLRGEVGVLALGHGYGDQGDAQFEAGFAEVAKTRPTAAALGMAMMGSVHMQRAVDALEAAGAKTIVVVPTEIGQRTDLTRQWLYILGLEEHSAYLDVPRLKTKARLVMAAGPTASSVVSDILAANLRTISRDPAHEVAVIIAHGPADEQENAAELADLEQHAATVRKALGLAGAWAATLQDDAPAAMREANVKRVRDHIAAETAAGRRVLVTPLLITGRGYVSKKIHKDLEGLEIEMVDVGLTESPLFAKWVATTVEAALAGKGN